MGIFQRFREYQTSRRKSQIERAAKIAKNPKAIREDRWAALDFLAQIEEFEEAVPALLPRFDFSLEHGINDTKEKELVFKAITRFKEQSIPLVAQWITTTDRVAWPIKILKDSGTREEVTKALLSALNHADVSFDQAAVDKNYDVLCYLRDYQVVEHLESLTHFLKDPDERVRYAMVELLIEQDHPKVCEWLEGFLLDPTVENTRLRQAVIRAFLQKNWRVTEVDKFKSNPIAQGIKVTNDGSLSFTPP